MLQTGSSSRAVARAFELFVSRAGVVKARAATEDDFSGHFFRIFEIIIVCFGVAIYDLVHDVETIFHLSYVLTTSGNLS